MAKTGFGLTVQEYYYWAEGLQDPIPAPTRHDWTVNYNAQAYVQVPEWESSNGQVEFELFLGSTNEQNFIAPSGSDAFANPVVLTLRSGEFGCSSNRRITSFIDNTQLIRGANGGVFSQVGVLYRVRIEISENASVLFLAASSSRTNFSIGQISNLRLTDLDNPANSRHYPSVINAADMPDSAVLVDVLGDGSTDGVITNPDPNQPYAPLLGQNQHYLGGRSDGTYQNGVDTANNRMSSSDTGTGLMGSWQDSPPITGSILRSNNGAVVTVLQITNSTDIEYSVVNGNAEQIQLGYQYPNTFSVETPSD